jgi:ribonuclease HI
MMMMTWWRIWHRRNKVVHDKPAPSIVGSRHFLCSYLEWLLCIKENPTANQVKGKTDLVFDHMLPKQGERRLLLGKKDQNKWTKPPLGWAKLNVDGSWSEDADIGGIGMVLRDDAGEIIFTACRHLPSCHIPLEAELQACADGLNLALLWSDLPIILESDCLMATKMITDLDLDRSHLAGLVKEVKELCCGKRTCRIVHISRELNGVSHSLAKFSRLNSCTEFWFRSGPDVSRLACNQDNTPIP